MKLMERKDVPVELTWDMSLLYASEEDYEKDLEKAKELCTQLEEYKGKLNDSDNIVACLKKYEELGIIQEPLGCYATLPVSVDTYDSAAEKRAGLAMSLFTDISARLSFIESELSQADEKVLSEAIAKAEGSANYLKDILRNKPHQLSPETEEVLSRLYRSLDASYDIYEKAKLADMRFDDFEVNGKTYPLGYSLFEDDYEYVIDTDVRRAAFKAFYSKLKQYENVTAACYDAYCLKEKQMAKVRGFENAIDADLFYQKVTREMYDRQIDMITKDLSPIMRKYARALKAAHHLDKMTWADLKLPLDAEYDPEVSIDQTREYIHNALQILGDDYVAMVDEAFKNRWFDLAKNQGKETGGFCSSPYRKNSYILMSFNNKMSDVFTAAHELGHAGHFRACSNAQSLFDTNVSGYVVEAPSTMNELLLSGYLLRSSDDKRFKRWVLSTLIQNTYYHNMVTHLREAWYQREVYKIVERGESVNAEMLNDIFKRNLETFWGDDVELVEGCELTWMRQPHYYMGLYSYCYSASLTIATAAYRLIEKEGAPAVERWKEMLAAGSTLGPIELAKLAGVDVTTDQPLKETIAYIGEIVDQICELTEEIDGIHID
ncbi:MAG: oligoendopeptidase F [Erysipelotrichaceae bacterium]|nr:oligoendopeptidase F [Erysipelotrichaceae bacterium]